MRAKADEPQLPERAAGADDAVVILLDDRHFERLSRFEALQQGASAVVLLSAGYHRFKNSDGGSPVFAGALFVAGLLLLLAAIRELRGRVSAHVGWLNLAAGTALLTEWVVSISDGSKLFRPSLVAGIVSLGFGLFDAPLQRRRRRRRHLRIDAEGIACRINPFRRFRVGWADLRWVDVRSDALRFGRGNGKQNRLPLRRYHNAAELTAAIIEACRSRDVEIRTAEDVASTTSK